MKTQISPLDLKPGFSLWEVGVAIFTSGTDFLAIGYFFFLEIQLQLAKEFILHSMDFLFLYLSWRKTGWPPTDPYATPGRTPRVPDLSSRLKAAEDF